jgi:hypothetical protein
MNYTTIQISHELGAHAKLFCSYKKIPMSAFVDYLIKNDVDEFNTFIKTMKDIKL